MSNEMNTIIVDGTGDKTPCALARGYSAAFEQ